MEDDEREEEETKIIESGKRERGRESSSCLSHQLEIRKKTKQQNTKFNLMQPDGREKEKASVALDSLDSPRLTRLLPHSEKRMIRKFRRYHHKLFTAFRNGRFSANKLWESTLSFAEAPMLQSLCGEKYTFKTPGSQPARKKSPFKQWE